MKRTLDFVGHVTLLLGLTVVTFFVLLPLKTQIPLSSSTFQMTLLAMVVYEGIAVFSKSLRWWHRVVGLALATVTYILVFAVTKYVLVEVYAQNFIDVFWGVGIADDFALVVGAAVQLALMYHWRRKTQAAARCFYLLPWQTCFHRATAAIKALSSFKGAVIALLLFNAFLSYQAWVAADDALWQASEAHEAATSAYERCH